MYQAMPGDRGTWKLDEKAWYARHLIFNVLDVDVPMISAVNGPCNMHSEVPIMADIVLASEDAYFQDASHFPRGQVPGDGQHVIWSVLAGHNRARYFLLTGQKLSAHEAKEWGVVNEVLPKDKLLDRAWEHARELVKRPPLTLRYTRQLFTNPLKRAFVNELGHGLGRETYAQRVFFPFGGEMEPLDRAWDQQPWTNGPTATRTKERPTMTGIQQKLATGRGKYTPEYPELGTGPVNYEDSISEEFFARRAQGGLRAELAVHRPQRAAAEEGLLLHPRASGQSGVDRHHARSRRQRVRLPQRLRAPRQQGRVAGASAEELSGTCRQFSCKYHGWRYGLDGGVAHITNEGEFFDLDKSKLQMPPVHCDEWAGFIFVNLAKDPEPLRSFLGEGLLEIEKYPFHLMTQRYGFSTRIKGNWKLAVDSVCEWYHPPYVHGRFIDPDLAKAETLVPPIDSYHYDLFKPHMLTSVPGPPQLQPREPGNAGEARREQKWVYRLFRAGLFGPDDVPDIGPLPEFLNRGDIESWGNDQFWVFPNISIQMWARNFYITYTYWPETVDTHIYEIDLYFVPPANAHERLAQELVVDSTIEFAMQDVNTIEATHSALKTRAQDTFFLSDQELLIRQFHSVIRETVAAHQAGEKKES